MQVDGGSERSFEGWLDLMAAIEGLRPLDGPQLPAPPPGPQ